MRQKFTLISVLLLSSYFGKAQQIVDRINAYGVAFPIEKISLHFDKEAYLPGETIWFKAYLFEENLPSAKSTNFYAGLYDEQGKLVQQMHSPIINSSTDGHFDIPDSLKSRQLTCRAYTSWMLSLDSSSAYSKTIRIISKTSDTTSVMLKTPTSLQFFPEGGDIIEGTKNTIAFKANFSNGLPVELSGSIKNKQTGAEVMPFKTMHDGMGRFDLEVEKGDRFFAEWTDTNGVIHETALPAAKPVGVSLKMTRLKDNLYYNIVNTLPGDSLHLLMYIYQKVFYKANISVKEGEPFNGMVPVKNLPTGVMQLTIFDAAWQPVAERVAFINNNNFSSSVAINNTELNIKRRGKNSIEIAVPDTIPFNLSLSITDAELNDAKAGRNIFTDMFLAGDVRGYIHNPVYYFTANSDAAIAANLDLVMLTHGWRRYNWKHMLEEKVPAIDSTEDQFLTLKGEVSLAAMKKIGAGETITLILKTKDSANHFYSVKPDSKGAFSTEGIVFFDSSAVSYSFKKNKLLNEEITISKSSFPYAPPPVWSSLSGFDSDQQLAAIKKYLNNRKDTSTFNKNKTLDAVVVKGRRNWKNDPLYKMDQRYTTGLFTGTNGFGFDVAHDGMAKAKFDIYNYMMGKVPGLSIDFTGGGKTFRATDGVRISYFINESGVDNDQIALINVDDIAYVKYIDRYAGELGLPHALSFYLKKGEDRINNASPTDMKLVKVAGYTPIKEFYSPDYSKSNTTEHTDNRITLLWLPYITTDAVTQKLPVTFYNNDFSKKLKVVLEGINDEGKMVHIEKTLE